MDEIKQKASIEVSSKGDETVVRVLVPKALLVDLDVALVQLYLAARYDVSSFSSTICDGLDRCLSFSLKDAYFDVKRFGYLLFSL